MSARICIISTQRASLDETIHFINYHLNIGIDEIIIFFDDPNDPAAAYLSDYPSVRPVRCDDAYWLKRAVPRPIATVDRQEINVNFGMELAAESGCDWIVHIDSDELLLPKRDIKDAFLDQQSDVVRFPMKEVVADRDYYANIFDAIFFKEPILEENENMVALAKSRGCSNPFFEGEYFRAHSRSKSAIRLAAKIEWMGNHGPKRPRMTEVTTDKVTLLHYDCVGTANWKNKWLLRIDDKRKNPRIRANRGKQRDLFIEASGNAKAELELYARLHKISEHDKQVLMELGLLSVVRIPHELFAHSGNLPRSQSETSALFK